MNISLVHWVDAMPSAFDPPRLSPRDMVRSGLCVGCSACVSRANAVAFRMELDRYGQYQPTGAPECLRRGSPEFARVCPFSPYARNEDQLAERLFPGAGVRDAAVGGFCSAYVGHVADKDFRVRGSSGGMVSWVLAELLRTGRIDGAVHVGATTDPHREKRFFRNWISRTENKIRAGREVALLPG